MLNGTLFVPLGLQHHDAKLLIGNGCPIPLELETLGQMSQSVCREWPQKQRDARQKGEPAGTRTISLQTKRRTFIKDFSTHHASAPDMAKALWNLEYEKHCVTDLIPLDAQRIPPSRSILQTAPYCTLQNTQGNKHKHSNSVRQAIHQTEAWFHQDTILTCTKLFMGRKDSHTNSACNQCSSQRCISLTTVHQKSQPKQQLANYQTPIQIMRIQRSYTVVRTAMFYHWTS